MEIVSSRMGVYKIKTRCFTRGFRPLGLDVITYDYQWKLQNVKYVFVANGRQRNGYYIVIVLFVIMLLFIRTRVTIYSRVISM